MPQPTAERLISNIDPRDAADDGDTLVGQCHITGVITSVTITPLDDITGDDDDSRTYDLINVGSDGSGDTVIATLPMVADTNGAKYTEQPMPMSEALADFDDRRVSAGDMLILRETSVGTGLASPGARIEVEIARS